MLVLMRNEGQVVWINGNIRVTVVEIRDRKVRLGFDAPADVKIYRQELLSIPDLNQCLRLYQSPFVSGKPA